MVQPQPHEVDPHERRRQLQELVQQSWKDTEARRAEARKVLYRDVEELVNRGFLSHQLRVSGVDISMRSLSPGDLHLLQHRAGMKASGRTWKAWLVASSVWMVGGINLLPDRQSPVRIYQAIRWMPRPAMDILFSIVAGMFKRLHLAVSRTEAYCYEPHSRVNWRLCGRVSPASDTYTGIPGSELLGMNHVQRMWVAFNLAEDDRENQIQGWEAAKLIAAAAAPKGVKKLNRADEALRNQEERRRRETIERMVREALFGPTVDDETGEMVVLVRGQPVAVPRVKTATSADDLAEQMRMWIAGEKDFHDLVVDTYKDRIRQQFDEERRRREEGQKRLLDAPGVSSTSSGLVGYTPDQIRELRPDLLERRTGTKRIFDNSAPVALYRKFLAADANQGHLAADEAGVYVPDEEDQEQSLQDAVRRRKPSFSTEPIGPLPVRGLRRPEDEG